MRVSLILVAVFISQPARAYVDPGTGAIMIQGLLTLIAVVSVALRKYWTLVKSWFRSAKDTPPDESKED